MNLDVVLANYFLNNRKGFEKLTTRALKHCLCSFCMKLLTILIFFLVITSVSALNISKDQGEVRLYFCNHNNCSQGLISELNQSSKLECAFYDMNIPSLVSVIKTKDYNLVLDKKLEEDNLFEKAFYLQQSAYMHHKFCIIDNNKVLTGSMNPTRFGTQRNDNNFILIESEILAQNYRNELNYLLAKDSPKNINIFALNDFVIENYFCPRECSIGINRLLKLINLSNKSIHVAAFSLTSEEIFLALIDAHERGVEVNIIMEKRMMNSKSSKFEILKTYGINIIFDLNPGSMHHKFIVIDNEIVQFGSLNYSENAIKRNNENILIIYNNQIATAFVQEFERLWIKYS
jgi:phosphatidylserine/phosphatidylglycerophosphate/cardiolipin synthase-like enzyme